MLSEKESPAQVCFWGTGLEKPAAKNLYRNSAIDAESRETDRLGKPFFLYFSRLDINKAYATSSNR
jgi:hypothetical protein